jgi:hypothetical protein
VNAPPLSIRAHLAVSPVPCMQLWMGMVVDALLNSNAASLSSDIYWTKLFPENVQKRLLETLTQLEQCIELESTRGAPTLHEDVAFLLTSAAVAWRNASINETPEISWLATYLQQEALSIYKVGEIGCSLLHTHQGTLLSIL